MLGGIEKENRICGIYQTKNHPNSVSNYDPKTIFKPKTDSLGWSTEAWSRAKTRELLEANLPVLHKIAARLMAKETMDGGVCLLGQPVSQNRPKLRVFFLLGDLGPHNPT